MPRRRQPSPPSTLPLTRVRTLLDGIAGARFLVVGDVMLDQFIWGVVRRISPEAPVPVVDFQRESFMAGGAANVARNLTALGAHVRLVGVTGDDGPAEQLAVVLRQDGVDASGMVRDASRTTGVKTRVIAHHQHVVRLDRERVEGLSPAASEQLLESTRAILTTDRVDAVIVGDYAKGVVSQPLIAELQRECRARGIWLSLDPKPSNRLDLTGLSLLTPNRKEAFELAGREDIGAAVDPPRDEALLGVGATLLDALRPALLLVTLGGQGMLLCRRGHAAFHIPTLAREVFDVSGAGDTVIASITAAISGGASPHEAAIFSNHAAGVVVRKVGTAIVTPAELLASFTRDG